MKKRNTIITVLSIVVVLALLIFVQPIQSIAIDALSIFRVRDINTIIITFDDIEHLTESIQELKSLMPEKTKDAGAPPNRLDFVGHNSPFVPIESTGDFAAFDLKLPRALNSEAPKLMMLDAHEQAFVIDPDETNEAFSMLGAQPLPDSTAGAAVTLRTPAIIVAEYSENILIAAQMPAIEGDAQAVDALCQSFLSLPQLTDNLRSQLAGVDLASGIVYVPVIEGFGRRTTVGSSTGYLYAISDLDILLSSLSVDQLVSGIPMTSRDSYEDASVLIWTRSGVLYILAGNQPSDTLARIAGSVR